MKYYINVWFPAQVRGWGWIACALWFPVAAVTVPASAQEGAPRVSNREPAPGEAPYSPPDGSTVQTSPPGFVWLPEPDAQTYTLECSSDPGFASPEYSISQLTLNVHCPAYLFDTGEWHWRYRYETADGRTSEWSLVRSFTIPAGAVPFPKPRLLDLVRSMPREHPRLFLRPGEAAQFAEDRKTFDAALWENFIRHADEMLETPVVADEPPPYPSDGPLAGSAENIRVWRENRRITVNAVDHAANLAFAYLLTGDERYGNRSKEWTLAVMAWPPDGATSYRVNDECAMPIVSRVSRAYDWTAGLFSETERQLVADVMRARGLEIYHHLRERSNHTARPYNSHNNRAWHFLGEAGIVFIDRIPEARQWLDYAMDVFYNVYPVWSGDDGGWHEGIAYWNSYLRRVTWWLDIMKSAFDIDGYKKPFFSRAGDFPLYVHPPRSKFGGFGDGAAAHPWTRNVPLMNVLAHQTKNPHWMWYVNQAGPQDPPEKPVYQDLLRADIDPFPERSPANLPPSRLFADTGIASMHTRLAEPEADVHVLFKSSPFGTQSHGFNAQNSLLLSAFGEPLLIWSGRRDWHGSEHHANWMWETASDNALTVNGAGQIKHSREAKGSIVGHYFGPVDYVAGEAAEAYGGRLEKYVRHVLFAKPDAIFVVDEVKAPQPARFALHFHAPAEFNVRHQGDVRVKNGPASARIEFATNAEMDVTQFKGFVPPPEGIELDQWHLKAETRVPAESRALVTMIHPYRQNEAADVISQYQMVEGTEVFGYWINRRLRLGLLVNAEGEGVRIGQINTDARLALLIEDGGAGRVPSVFAAGATFVDVGGRRVAESQRPENVFIPRGELSFLEGTMGGGGN